MFTAAQLYADAYPLLVVMDKEQLNQNRMGTVLDLWLDKHAAALAPSAVAQAEAADVRAAYAAVQKSLGQGTTATKEVTQGNNDAEADILRLLPALLGPLRSVARKTHDAPLLARVTITKRQLAKLRPAPLRDVVQHLLADGLTYKTPLATYGYTPAVQAILQKSADAFAATVGVTKSLLNEGKGTHDTTDDLLRAFLQQCYELDDAMNIFRVLDPALHRDYLQARKVGKSGGGKGPLPGGPAPA